MTASLPPLPIRKPQSLRSQVEDFLREAILNGRFKPGERLIERELCEMLDVSRPSLREALRRLEAEKLITIVMHRGPVVASITEAEAAELYEIRALLESHAVHEFTRLASDAAIEELGNAVGKLHAAAETGDHIALLGAKTAFYNVIFNGCGNSIVKEILTSLLSRISMLRSTSFSSPNRLPVSLREIDDLYALIKQRDAAAAQ